MGRQPRLARSGLARRGGGFEPRLVEYGALAGGELYRHGFDANRDRPRLRTHDARGRRIDTVEFHPAYHALMHAALRQGVAGLSWNAATRAPGAQVARAALSYLHHQADAGTSCPLTMTHAAVPVLRREPLLAHWADKASALAYDARDIPMADKAGVTLGMGMTEKQGGSDVRANRTVATPRDDGSYSLVGHKWFFSAPMSDGFLVLAQAPGGLTCLLMPRRLDNGARNAFRLIRLKDTLGDWSNGSSEVEFTGAQAFRMGAEGRGIATILEMVMMTRLDCMLGAAAEMRLALAHAVHHARHRQAFGARLIDQPLMRNVLADMALEVEAAVAFALRVAHAADRAESDPAQAAFARVATAVGKFWICKRVPVLVNEAQECLGGAGYVEESILPRLYRQAPLNSIWEGSGNIQCLDVLRALGREPAAAVALRDALQWGAGSCDVFDRYCAKLLQQVQDGVGESDARLFVERIALALQASVLLQAKSPVADTFIASRLAAPHALAFGTLARTVEMTTVLERVRPPA